MRKHEFDSELANMLFGLDDEADQPRMTEKNLLRAMLHLLRDLNLEIRELREELRQSREG